MPNMVPTQGRGLAQDGEMFSGLVSSFLHGSPSPEDTEARIRQRRFHPGSHQVLALNTTDQVQGQGDQVRMDGGCTEMAPGDQEAGVVVTSPSKAPKY